MGRDCLVDRLGDAGAESGPVGFRPVVGRVSTGVGALEVGHHETGEQLVAALGDRAPRGAMRRRRGLGRSPPTCTARTSAHLHGLRLRPPCGSARCAAVRRSATYRGRPRGRARPWISRRSPSWWSTCRNQQGRTRPPTTAPPHDDRRLTDPVGDIVEATPISIEPRYGRSCRRASFSSNQSVLYVTVSR